MHLRAIVILMVACGASFAVDVPVLTLASASKPAVKTALPPAQYTRTALHVSRSLQPDATQLLHVKTRAGDMATLIVKKRDGKQHGAPLGVGVASADANQTAEAIFRNIKLAETAAFQKQRERNAEDRKRADEAVKSLPSPASSRVTEQIVKTPISVSDQAANAPSNLRSRSAGVKSSSSGAGGASQPTIRVPEPVYIRSMPMFVKGEREDELKRGRSIMKIGSDGIPVIQGVRMPDDESDKQVWRNARVINGVLVPNEKPDQIIKKENKKKITTTRLESVPFERRQDLTNSFASSHIDRLVPLYRYPAADGQTESRIMDFIKSANQRELIRNGQANSRARMIHYPEARRSQDHEGAESTDQSSGRVRFPSRRSDEQVQEPESQKFEARMLHYGSPIYPTSLLYTPQGKKPARLAFEEGVRTPVLQYAHPELGVQPARLQPKTGKLVSEGGASGGASASATMAMFQQDLHSDRSPYVGMETEIEPEAASDKRSSADSSPKSNYYQSPNKESTHNKVFAYDNQNYEFPKKNYYQSHDSYGLGNDDYIKRYPNDGYNSVNSYNAYSGPYLVKVVERPFWEQITDSIRDHVQTGMDRVSDITRPVVEPLIEATHKISKNLGFTQRSHAEHDMQDKVGTVASYPVLLPALGLMAGGAALGLGAVAVGRYLDVDMLRRRSQEGAELTDAEHRALQAALAEEWVPIQSTEQARAFPVQAPGEWVSVNQDQIENLKPIDASNQDAGKLHKKSDENLDEEKPQITRLQKVVAVSREEFQGAERVASLPSLRKRRASESESDLLADILQSVEITTPSGLEHLENHSAWDSQPCSKKLFCETMVQQSEDAILLMEKKMSTFLNLIKPNSDVSHHLEEVMSAVKRHDCSQFKCTSRRAR